VSVKKVSESLLPTKYGIFRVMGFDAQTGDQRTPYVVLLKGAAVAGAAYDDVAWRPMADLDLWVRDDDMDQALPWGRAVREGAEARAKAARARD